MPTNTSLICIAIIRLVFVKALEMIYLKDLIEIHAYQSKLIFKDLGIEPIESGLD
ncbi:hypothetical protein [Taylorella equigenitalis]|uniref:hypothetical protein n=1 Tax=Taylorella equigenitalis TaxID=29575 RepID=UPI0023AF4EBD|nr:hypothetical protein [Taylorella equigenitalis]WED99930.1 hypothetical protein PZB79_04940 [Taylorella equigenitalis]